MEDIAAFLFVLSLLPTSLLAKPVEAEMKKKA
jgi:hypothetical protein